MGSTDTTPKLETGYCLCITNFLGVYSDNIHIISA